MSFLLIIPHLRGSSVTQTPNSKLMKNSISEMGEVINMSKIITLLAVILFLVGSVTWTIYKFIPKLLWCIPVIALIISGSLLLRDIYLITSEPTFSEKWELYFHNDWSMAFYLFYLPIIVISVLATVFAYILKHRKSKSV